MKAGHDGPLHRHREEEDEGLDGSRNATASASPLPRPAPREQSQPSVGSAADGSTSILAQLAAGRGVFNTSVQQRGLPLPGIAVGPQQFGTTPHGFVKTPISAASSAAATGAGANISLSADLDSGDGEGADLDGPERGGGVTWSRLSNIKAAAAKDKQTLLTRIEELSEVVRQLQVQLRAKDETLERYRAVLGPLHEFSAKQVQLREEIVLLRDNVRAWQDKEAVARSQVKALQKTVEALRRSGDHDSAESRLADLQERLALAHLQKHEAETELGKVHDLFAAQRTHNEAMGAAGAGDHQGWRLRGKLADLELIVKQKSDMISSLQKAATELEAVVGTASGKQIGAANRRCPGCDKPQWSSPFCPSTGHRHLGFDGRAQADNTARSPSPNHQLNGVHRSSVPATVDEAIASGAWRKLVEIGTFDVSYQHVESGRVVTDLQAELEKQRAQEIAHAGRDARNRSESRRRDVGGESAITRPQTTPGETEPQNMVVRPALHKEVERLVEQLRRKNDEIAKLKALLKAVSASGMVGVAMTPTAASQSFAAPPAAATGGAGKGPKEADEVPKADSGTSTPPDAWLVAFGNEDDSQSVTRLKRLEGEKTMLNQRCTELVLHLARRDDEIRNLTQRLDAMRFDAATGSHSEIALRNELSAAHDALLRERRRVAALEDEIRRLSRL